MESALEQIWRARGRAVALSGGCIPKLRLLVDPETFYKLKCEKLFAEENQMKTGTLTIFGIPIAETQEINGWELVEIKSSSMG